MDAWLLGGFAWEKDSLLFSHLDRWIGGTNLSRIGRMYVSDLLGGRGGSMSILAGTCMSDHAPVVIDFFEGDRRFS